MSWFLYGEHSNERIGVWLRYETNPDLVTLIRDSNLVRMCDTVQRVIVNGYDEQDNKVWLQIWCKNVIDSIRGKNRYNVFTIKTNINPDWICEGDLP